MFFLLYNLASIVSELLSDLSVLEPQERKGLIPLRDVTRLFQQSATAFPITEPDVRVDARGAVASCTGTKFFEKLPSGKSRRGGPQP